ncbi:MAG: ribosome silencing factor [Anaerolineae bacterium]|nr:ribosome silencing factor [Thermoflexales bacterium]MCX7938824.1 ribosome silencing factor [Thermoflexales bacterium]MDW8054875.1 ribosome silencing factor [Anaerolineae bacterium]MDW8293171.1 ribosome silencing factor [Anaerolineae bacterium]
MPRSAPEKGLDLARAIVAAAADKKAENIVLLDLRKLASFADYFVICSGASERQLRGIAEAIEEKVGPQFGAPRRIEGIGSGGWVLMDYGDVIVHIFSPSSRAYYNLESLWSKAPVLLRVQ